MAVFLPHNIHNNFSSLTISWSRSFSIKRWSFLAASFDEDNAQLADASSISLIKFLNVFFLRMWKI